MRFACLPCLAAVAAVISPGAASAQALFDPDQNAPFVLRSAVPTNDAASIETEATIAGRATSERSAGRISGVDNTVTGSIRRRTIDEAEVALWRGRIRRALGERTSLLSDLLPELVQLVGDGPAVATETGERARLRLQLCFDELLGTLSRPDHPLVLVLDDVQWADPASMELLGLLARDDAPRAMLLVLVAGVNALWYQLKIAPQIDGWSGNMAPPAEAKVIGALSLLLWFGVLSYGRLIPYLGTG